MSAPLTGPRRAEPVDADALRALVAAAYAPYLHRMDRPPAPMLEDLNPFIAAGQMWVLGAPPQGLICLVASDEGLLVEMIAVQPHAQGTGLGGRLLAFAEVEARRAGFERLRLYTNEVMHENLGLYRHLGFDEYERREQDGYRRVFMEKAVARS